MGEDSDASIALDLKLLEMTPYWFSPLRVEEQFQWVDLVVEAVSGRYEQTQSCKSHVLDYCALRFDFGCCLLRSVVKTMFSFSVGIHYARQVGREATLCVVRHLEHSKPVTQEPPPSHGTLDDPSQRATHKFRNPYVPTHPIRSSRKKRNIVNTRAHSRTVSFSSHESYRVSQPFFHLTSSPSSLPPSLSSHSP